MVVDTISELILKPLTTNEIKPKGWLLRQLQIQAEGLSGNLDKFWPDIKESKWIGGDKEGWERVPYWLDGFIPLAYLLNDDDMKKRAKKYIDAIIHGQEDDGWICPCSKVERERYDMWALFLLLKVLVVYYECSKDERIEEVIYKATKNLDRHIDRFTIFNWASTRWFEMLIPIYWLYERRNEGWLLNLAIKMKAQGFDYQALYENWPYEKPQAFGHWSQMNHVVNQAMAIKSLALFSRISKKEEDMTFAELMIEKLSEYHGTATGIFTGDECLSGNSPIQGTELCSVAEFMYSLEHLIQITGETKWADKLEYIAYNALPATISPDMWTHQYDQLVNQVECSRIEEGSQPFNTNNGEAHLYGLEPHYGCCTSNFNQAWPKFALSAFMTTDKRIACVTLAPSTVETAINDVDVKISLSTDYPFHNKMIFCVNVSEPVEFAFDIRIPGFSSSATVNGADTKSGEFYTISKTWYNEETIEVVLQFETEFIERPENMVAVRRGPLLYSIAIEEEWEMVNYGNEEKLRIFPHCDYELFPKSQWNYGYADKKIEYTFNGVGDIPFSTKEAPIEAKAKVVEIDWPKTNGVVTKVPVDRKPLSQLIKEVTLLPYGCTNLRMTEVPYIDLEK
ncbi:beta-L-arabinofuranosidase domain-containing protein [Metabacillus sp. Hm71]|uniref:beta-L-arabinofuranosidase domain-containing protein n=1 Tax=Metabacillus sp. Hm71 TaxID=3450743 RepID=UPI003F437473